MHNIVKDLYNMCMFNIPINLKSLLNTIYDDKHIRVSGYIFEDVEDLYDHIESNERYSWLLGLDLYTNSFNPEYTPHVYRYSYLDLDIYDKQYDDWFNLTIFFSREDIMVIGNYNDNYNTILNNERVSIDDNIRIITVMYNHSFEANMNIYDPENIKFIREDSSLRQHLPELEEYYHNETRRMANLLKQYEEGDENAI